MEFMLENGISGITKYSWCLVKGVYSVMGPSS